MKFFGELMLNSAKRVDTSDQIRSNPCLLYLLPPTFSTESKGKGMGQQNTHSLVHPVLKASCPTHEVIRIARHTLKEAELRI
jgi:hypothetical protein